MACLRWNQGALPAASVWGSGLSPASSRPWIVATAFLLTLTGCSNDAFVPPPPPELSAVPSSVNPTSPEAGKVPNLVLIMSSEANPDHETWELAGRQEAGRRKVILVVEKLAAGAPASAQADLIRRAVHDGKATALLVEPADDPAVVEALNDVRAGGTPVVLLGRSVKPRDPAAAFAVVRFEPYEPVARKAIDSLAKEARSYGLPPQPHALIARNTRYGPWFEPRIELLSRLLKEAGFAKVTVVPFDGTDENAQRLLTQGLEADPSVAALIGGEDVALAAALAVHDKVKEKRAIYVGGFMTVERSMNSGSLTRVTVTVDRNVPSFIIQAIQLASDLAEGLPVGLERVVPTPMHLRTAGVSGVRMATPTPGPAPGELKPKIP